MTKISWFLSRLPNTKHKIALFFVFRIYIAFPIAVSPIGKRKKKKEDYMKFCFVLSVSIGV